MCDDINNTCEGASAHEGTGHVNPMGQRRMRALVAANSNEISETNNIKASKQHSRVTSLVENDIGVAYALLLQTLCKRLKGLFIKQQKFGKMTLQVS